MRGETVVTSGRQSWVDPDGGALPAVERIQVKLMKKASDPETDNAPLFGRKKPDIEKEPETEESPLQFPGDLRPEWEREDTDIANRKPDLEEIEEDANDL
jgi:hypothetical protein